MTCGDDGGSGVVGQAWTRASGVLSYAAEQAHTYRREQERVRALESLRSFLYELKRRHVVRATAAYVVAAFALLQGIELVAEPLGLPASTFPIAVRVAAAGLVLTLVLSWLYDLRPGGIHRTRSLAHVPAGQPEPAPAPQNGNSTRHQAERPTRLMVLPFRVLRSDPETDMLAFALPDAITCALAGISSIVVRSTVVAERLGAELTDLAAIGAAAGVDAVLGGTLQRGGKEIRLQAHLTAVTDGAVLWAYTEQLSAENLFAVQDHIARRIAKSLAAPLTPREQRRLAQDVPATPRAYELYLRANQLSIQARRWADARKLYHECLEEDPSYAPAAARLGRCCRLLGNFAPTAEQSEALFAEARAAFERAIALNPDLPMAHSLFAQFELNQGRSEDALGRLLARAVAEGTDVDTLIGLVHALRFCGLLQASLAADAMARERDPHARSSVAHTWFMRGDYEAALRTRNSADIGYIEGLALFMLGRTEESLRALTQPANAAPVSGHDAYVASLRALVQQRKDESVAAVEMLLPTLRDGEAVYYLVRQLAYLGEHETALHQLERVVVELGFFPVETLRSDPWLAALRAAPRFRHILYAAEARLERARATFLETGGEALLAPVSTMRPQEQRLPRG